MINWKIYGLWKTFTKGHKNDGAFLYNIQFGVIYRIGELLVSRRKIILMIYCNHQQGKWIECAIDYLPDEIFDQVENKIAFTILESDGFRLGKKVKNHDEVIILSPWIFPSSHVTEIDPEIRYLIFCILHEIAHVICNHKPPDEISKEENMYQEKEATSRAIQWFNNYVKDKSSEGFKELNESEIQKQQDINQERVSKFLGYE